MNISKLTENHGQSNLLLSLSLLIMLAPACFIFYFGNFFLAALLLTFPLLIKNAQPWFPEKKLAPLLKALSGDMHESN
jgi:hypothetical protein